MTRISPAGKTAREFFLAGWRARPRSIFVFSHGQRGVPTLGTMSRLADEVGATVDHLGFGVFQARRAGSPVFAFDAGGAMNREKGFSWSRFDFERGATAKDKEKILAMLDHWFARRSGTSLQNPRKNSKTVRRGSARDDYGDAYLDGVRAGRADALLGRKSRYSSASFPGDPLYSKWYSSGYNAGWSTGVELKRREKVKRNPNPKSSRSLKARVVKGERKGATIYRVVKGKKQIAYYYSASKAAQRAKRASK